MPRFFAAAVAGILAVGIVATPFLLRSKIFNAISPARSLPAGTAFFAEIEPGAPAAEAFFRAVEWELAVPVGTLPQARAAVAFTGGEPIFFVGRGVGKWLDFGPAVPFGAGFAEKNGPFFAFARSRAALKNLGGDGKKLRGDPDFRQILATVPGSGEIFFFARGEAGRGLGAPEFGAAPRAFGGRVDFRDAADFLAKIGGESGDETPAAGGFLAGAARAIPGFFREIFGGDPGDGGAPGRFFVRFFWPEGVPIFPEKNSPIPAGSGADARLFAEIGPAAGAAVAEFAPVPEPPLVRAEDPFFAKLRAELGAAGLTKIRAAIGRQAAAGESVLRGAFFFLK